MRNITSSEKATTMTAYVQAIWNESEGFWEVTTIQTDTGRLYCAKPNEDYGFSQRVDTCKVACGDECVIAAALLNANGMDVQECLRMDNNPIVG